MIPTGCAHWTGSKPGAPVVAYCNATPAHPTGYGLRCDRHLTPPTPPPSGLTAPRMPLREAVAPEQPAPGAPASPGASAAARAALRAQERAARAAVTPHAYVGSTLTSRAAAERVWPKTGTQRALVLDALVTAHQRGNVGATDYQLQRHLDLPGNTERPRRDELCKAGLVEDSGITRVHEGTQHTVWKPTVMALLVASTA